MIALRAANGTPILKKYVVPETELTTASTEYCVQPVSYESFPGVTSRENPVDGRQVWVVPLQGEWIENETVPAEFTGACDPQPQYAMFVSEVELERLNLARTADEVIARKLADVALKLGFAEAIALEATGRISYDGSTIDASPENAAIYQSLMKSGTIPGLPEDMAGPPAAIGPDGASNSQFDAWELAAMTIGAAASKSTPFTIDTVQYYNRIIGFPRPTRRLHHSRRDRPDLTFNQLHRIPSKRTWRWRPVSSSSTTANSRTTARRPSREASPGSMSRR